MKEKHYTLRCHLFLLLPQFKPIMPPYHILAKINYKIVVLVSETIVQNCIDTGSFLSQVTEKLRNSYFYSLGWRHLGVVNTLLQEYFLSWKDQVVWMEYYFASIMYSVQSSAGGIWIPFIS